MLFRSEAEDGIRDPDSRVTGVQTCVFRSDGVSVVEWSQFVGDEIPADKLIIHLKKDDHDDDIRYLEFEPHGKRYEELVNELEKQL